MRIFLEAFVDTNLGDNLFLDIVTSRYHDHEFYMCIKPEYEESYRLIEKKIGNLHLIKTADKKFLKQMDGMLIVGGDMFADGADLSQIIYQTEKIKRAGGFVAFLGNSLFRDYSLQTQADLKVMFSHADLVVVREQSTYNQLKKMVPNIHVISLADMVFSMDLSKIQKETVSKGLMGISVRKKTVHGDEKAYQRYCREIRTIIKEYLKASEQHRVVLFSFSCGLFDDRKVVDDIVDDSLQLDGELIKHVAFDGDSLQLIKEIQKCDSMICTRFHALVLAVMLEKNFLPIIYEEKMERLLDEIGYSGVRQYYGNTNISEDIIEGLKKTQVSEEKLKQYLEKAEHFFDEIDGYLNGMVQKQEYRQICRMENSLYWIKPRVWGRKLYKSLKCILKKTDSF